MQLSLTHTLFGKLSFGKLSDLLRRYFFYPYYENISAITARLGESCRMFGMRGVAFFEIANSLYIVTLLAQPTIESFSFCDHTIIITYS